MKHPQLYYQQQVRHFYDTYDFSEVVTNPPYLIEKFISREIIFLKEHFAKGKSLLEIGCGYGRLLKVLAESQLKLAGIDYSITMINKAKDFLFSYPKIQLELMNATRLRFPANNFDYTICMNASLGNMPGMEVPVLKEMKRVTKPGGEIIITVFSQSARPALLENYGRLGLKIIREAEVYSTDVDKYC